MKPLFNHAELRQMALSAKRGKWTGLIKLDEVPQFAAWLVKEKGWLCQSPDVGQILRMYKDGWTIVVSYDGKHTRCERLVMALWYTYTCFKKG